MSRIGKIFLDEKNIDVLLNYVGEQLNIPKTQKAKSIFKEVLVSQMYLIYEKNKEKISKLNPEIILPKLNKKAIEGTIKQYNIQKLNIKQNNTKQNIQKKDEFNPMAMDSSYNDDYGSPILDNAYGDNKFYSATGEIIESKYIIQTDNNANDGNQKRVAKEEIQKKLEMMNIARSNDDYDFDENDTENTFKNYNMQGMTGVMRTNNNKQPQIDEATRKFLGNICSDMTPIEENNNNIDPSNFMNNDFNQNFDNFNDSYTTENYNNYNFSNGNNFNDYSSNSFNNNLNGGNFNNNLNGGNFNNKIEETYNNISNNTSMLSYGISSNDNNFLLNKKFKKKNELEEIINDKKKEIAYKHGLNVESLLNLKPHEIDKLIYKKKKKVSTNKSSSDTSNDNKSILKKKEKILERLKEQKKENQKYNKKLNNEISKLKDIDDTSETSKKEKKEEPLVITTKKNNKLEINANEWTEPKFYNNYQIELKQEFKNIQEFKLVGETDFPLLRPIIDSEHNNICIIQNKNKNNIELDEDDNYKLDEILESINSGLQQNNINITIKVDKNKHIVIEGKEKFDLELKKNSMGIYLGFQNKEYKNKNKYVSEKPHLFLEQNYFMFIKEISNDKPICKITPEGKVIQLINKTQNNINKLTIQYRYSQDINSALVEFYQENHKLTFEFIINDIKTKNLRF